VNSKKPFSAFLPSSSYLRTSNDDTLQALCQFSIPARGRTRGRTTSEEFARMRRIDSRVARASSDASPFAFSRNNGQPRAAIPRNSCGSNSFRAPSPRPREFRIGERVARLRARRAGFFPCPGAPSSSLCRRCRALFIADGGYHGKGDAGMYGIIGGEAGQRGGAASRFIRYASE